MQGALPLPRSNPVPRASTVARVLLAVLIATALSVAYLAQVHAQARLTQQLQSARRQALAARAEAVAAGVPANRMAWADNQLSGLAAEAAPVAGLLFLDQAWRRWAAAETAGYQALATHFEGDRVAYLDGLAVSLSDAVSRLDETLGAWSDAGGAPEAIQPLQTQVQALTTRALGRDPKALAKDVATAEALVQQAQRSLALQRQDDATEASYLPDEVAAATGNLGAEQQKAAQLAYDATGDAEAAAHFSVPGVAELAGRVSRDAAGAAASDPQALAGTVAWLRVDEGRLAGAMQTGMPAKAIYISTARQELRAYDHGKLAQESLVTTGRPELPTVLGSFSVLWKSSPWTMHSPFPRSSPFWYPDTRVQMVLWFHEGGYGIHDAYWRYRYGPGTNVDGAVPGTHGCVNVPWTPMSWLFHWADVGTPVTVG